MAHRVTPDERTRIIAAIKDGKSLGQVCREFHRAKGTVHTIAKDAGLTFDRSTTRNACEAHKIDAAARRAALADGLLDDAETLRQDLHAPTEVVTVTRDGKPVTYTTLKPTASDRRNLMVAVKVAVDGHCKLVEVDKPVTDGGRSEIRMFIEMMKGGSSVSRAK